MRIRSMDVSSMHVRRGMRIARGAVGLMMLGACAGMLGSAPAVRCEGASAPDRWMLQTGNVLQGVVSTTRGLPIPDATVRIRPLRADTTAERTAQSASQGAFAFDGVDAGRYVAQATAPGYGTWRDTVELAANRGTIPRIRLCSGRSG